MINALHIKNFQVFEDIEIKGLRRVNLIAGKNNAGKTAMLEALRILAATGNPTVVNNILKQRGHFKPSNASSFLNLFNKKSNSKELSIGSLRIFNNKEISPDHYSSTMGVNFGYGHSLDANASPDYPSDAAVFIPFNINMDGFKSLWEKIVLTPMEDEVFNIIRDTIEPRLIRLDFSSDHIKVRLKDEQIPVPLSSLGDGVQRILLMAIALVSAKNKMLLIDEFEAGLHHSVQKKLWEMVFEYATKWDIQVFATTHSQDTVRNFYYVASRQEYENEATFMRLQFDRLGVHEAQVYDMERLGQSLELHLETR